MDFDEPKIIDIMEEGDSASPSKVAISGIISDILENVTEIGSTPRDSTQGLYSYYHTIILYTCCIHVQTI